MLLLGRNKDQVIIIKVPPRDVEQVIEIKVLRGNRVTLGFTADKSISIDRLKES